MQAFEDIQNITIEIFYNDFVKSDGKDEFRIVVLGVWTIDIKERLKYLTDNPDNTETHHFIIRGNTHIRQRPKRSTRIVPGSE